MKPIPGNKMFNALKNEETIIMACNVRMTPGVAKGIFQAAKELDAPVMFEIAKSESDLKGGYTGLTPGMYAEKIQAAADEVGFGCWALHADHITVKKGTPEELDEVKQLIKAQIAANFTCYAIDASFLFDIEGATVADQLKRNIEVTTELAKFIKENRSEEFGLEVEVGEIGKKGEEGLVITSPEEAVTFIKALNANGVDPDAIAIANGSVHGNVYDKDGKQIPLASIDIPRTKAVAAALREFSRVRIAQHGITGTPLHIIATEFPKNDLIKGNVGTHWQNVVWNVMKEKEPELYNEIFAWVMENHKVEGKSEEEIFGKKSKLAIKVFFDKIYSMKPETVEEIRRVSYEDAKKFFEAFGAVGKASLVK